MSASKIKGTLLEFIIRNLLINSGFTKVKPDGLFIFNQRGLCLINGKGSAHDADVLMNPPIQIPFSYPTRINFECKAYNKKIGLTVIRNALGLRYDLNEFEIVTRDQIKERQNNRRKILACDDRQRYNYQIGVASVEDFTKDAFEFAAHNKIPLMSLRWFLEEATCNLFHQITDQYLKQFAKNDIDNLLDYLKGNKNQTAEFFLNHTPSHIQTILNEFWSFQSKVKVGLLESGDLIFLMNNNSALSLDNSPQIMSAQINFINNSEDRTKWNLNLNNNLKFYFYLPKSIVSKWETQSFDDKTAIDLKEKFFGRCFIFFKTSPDNLPFKIINIDTKWLDNLRNSND